MHQEKVQLNYLMIAPRKVRLIGNTLKGMSALEAQAQLMLRPQRTADALLKLLNSGLANVKHNKSITSDKMRVKQVIVDPAPVLKRALPRAQGRATSIFKRMSHVTLILEEMESAQAGRFVMPEPIKKDKKDKKPQKAKPTRAANAAEQKKDLEHSRPEKKVADTKEHEHDAEQRKPVNRGSLKRFFNRKAI